MFFRYCCTTLSSVFLPQRRSGDTLSRLPVVTWETRSVFRTWSRRSSFLSKCVAFAIAPMAMRFAAFPISFPILYPDTLYPTRLWLDAAGFVAVSRWEWTDCCSEKCGGVCVCGRLWRPLGNGKIAWQKKSCNCIYLFLWCCKRPTTWKALL